MQSIVNVESYSVLDIQWIYKIYEYRVIFLQYTKFSFYHYSIFQFSLPVKSILLHLDCCVCVCVFVCLSGLY